MKIVEIVKATSLKFLFKMARPLEKSDPGNSFCLEKS